ncbi:MAG: hypothetical protein M3P06_11455 [Acidobacteriota bacterium]|nr:hypothetical protein [Acidobacteriota bacterium]
MSEAPTTKKVELSNERWIELRTTKILSDVRYQLEDRHKRGFADETLDELAAIEARIVGWNFTEALPSDMKLRRQILDGLSEDDGIKLVMANRGVEPDPKGNAKRSVGSSTGTRRSKKKVSPTETSSSDEGSSPTSG